MEEVYPVQAAMSVRISVAKVMTTMMEESKDGFV